MLRLIFKGVGAYQSPELELCFASRCRELRLSSRYALGGFSLVRILCRYMESYFTAWALVEEKGLNCLSMITVIGLPRGVALD